MYGSETWRLTENNKRRVEATEMNNLRRSSRISKKERIRYVTIRQQIGLQETITKESTRKTEEKLDGRYKEGHERKKPK